MGIFYGRPDETGKIHIAKNVAIDDEKRRIAQQRQRLRNAAGGFQCAGRFGRVGNAQAPA